MKTINVYSVAYNRPEFLELQYNSALKYVCSSSKNASVNFVFLINTKEKQMRDRLVEECLKLGVSHIIIQYKENELYNGGLTAYNYVRDYFFEKASKDDYSVILDSDMFFYNYTNIDKIIDGNDVCAIYHQREKKFLGVTRYNYEYLWVGFMVFSHKNINWRTIRFEPYKNICDVGGMTYFFLRQNLKKGLKVKWIEHTADITHDFTKVLPEKLWDFYEPSMGFQLIENSIIHYYRGSNWDGNKQDFLKRKDEFLSRFLAHVKEHPFTLSYSYYYNSVAYSRKQYNGTPGLRNDKVEPTFGNYFKLNHLETSAL